jgi:hypothetical protein
MKTDNGSWPEALVVDTWLEKYGIQVSPEAIAELKIGVSHNRIEIEERERASCRLSEVCAAPGPKLKEIRFPSPLTPKGLRYVSDEAKAMRSEGYGYKEIADSFNKRDISTVSGLGEWHPGTVYRLLKKGMG